MPRPRTRFPEHEDAKQEPMTYSTYDADGKGVKDDPNAPPKVDARAPNEDDGSDDEPRQRGTVKGAPKARSDDGPAMMPVKLLRGYWPKGAPGRGKIPPGTNVDLPRDEAKDIIRKGIAERADPLPGDEEDG